ncbi:carbohydrate ABC transporter membrane protein 1 (CUT1 family) [Nonomuraea fuscirosea]|uniref:Carbohydrate ABC transporter membrane protein 1 (CUT1 family) n=1 Tax=Nonomuraea fuscirosea TaxID=1291556 RepID=A0A2T0MXV8_9ACTN|nr:sugar ABC transporter permease [Nonomuraea fuscirosea]PRX64084.1 carbohydrate ABC transporter membrane protein 1 (CUT1 family) [Nonomuraea fuscirosea]
MSSGASDLDARSALSDSARQTADARETTADGRRAAARRRWRGYLLFAAFALPNLALIAVFSYWPIIENVYLSFTTWDFISPQAEWAGLLNYQSLFSGWSFPEVLFRTLVWVVVVVVVTLVLGLALAMLFAQRLRGANAVQTLAFAPHVLSGAAIATIWLFIFDPNTGLSRLVFEAFGASSPAWTNDDSWALWALIIVSIWKGLGFVAIVYLVGIQQIPAQVLEAARIDGAGRWTQFRRMIFPLLSPTTFFLVITQTISAFQSFDVIAMMTGGGPARSTTTLSWFIYDEAFNRGNVGVSSAASMIMFVVLMAITVLQFRFVERRVHY